jgi:DNA-directed RNA polymerase beta' subunit
MGHSFCIHFLGKISKLNYKIEFFYHFFRHFMEGLIEHEVKEVESIMFGLYSAEEIISNSVAKIIHPKLSGENSIYDERMGTLEKDKICESCKKSSMDCPGHFGHIELHHPIFHPMYYRMIISFLKCFCIKCYKFLLTEEHLKLDNILRFHGSKRFDKVLEKIEKVDMCYHCNNMCPKIMFVNKESAIYYVYKKTKVLVQEEDVKKVFDNISNNDVRLLGFNPDFIHPKNLIITVLPVLPPAARPYVVSDDVTCDDDLTMQYTEIIKANNHLEDKSIPDAKYQKYIQTLKFRVKTLMNNSQGKARLTNGRPIKAIKERISGKEGLIRGNLMGKRCNQTSRTVIGPEPTCRLDELIVPKDISKILTVQVTVNKYNEEELTRIVNNDEAQAILRGGKRLALKYAIHRKQTKLLHGDIIIRNGKEIKVEDPDAFLLQRGDKFRRGNKEEFVQFKEKRFVNLQQGDIVERNLRNGDLVLLNRQPTLHKSSMLAKRVVLRDCKTFRFCLASTKAFNAD